MRRHEDEALHDLSTIVLNLIRSPPFAFSGDVPSQITPSGFAFLLLGVSLALMLCGSVTFFIGFVLMPWVLGFFMLFYVAGILSTISALGRSILCYATVPPPPPPQDVPAPDMEPTILGEEASVEAYVKWEIKNEDG
ncbi:hypothetical protein Fmac_013858 [Flemingia macrophylla]|uniref:Uncharacterized protein n=1 Tax=Flemingia macrophylla TaxID=520843 RepID=A0ABD1MC26_9FABA